MSTNYDSMPLQPTIDNTCPDCGRKPVTWREVTVLVGLAAVVIVLWEIGQAVYMAATS